MPATATATLKVSKDNVGRRVRIVRISELAARNPDNLKFIGRVGTIWRAVKSRNMYDLRDENGNTFWGSLPENVEFVE